MLIKLTKPKTEFLDERFLRRSFPSVALAIDIVGVYPIDEVLISFIEVATPSGGVIYLAASLPVGHEPWVDEVMRYHKLNSIFLKLLEVIGPISDQNPLQVYSLTRVVLVVS